MLNLLEARAPADHAALLHALAPVALGREAPGHVIGLTGPPGAGKSTLLCALVGVWRARRRSVAVLAVDPSSRLSGGSLLGDRARIAAEPGDRRVFIRSTAAGELTGGLAPGTRAAAAALAVAFDVVVIETVGVGQAETEVAEVADSVAVAVQPGAGDVLQFLKAGIMEIPDVLVVTKADLGEVADRSLRDLRAVVRALSVEVPVLAVGALDTARGVEELADALDAHRATLDLPARRLDARRAHALADFAAEHGARGLRALGGRRAVRRRLADQDPDLDAGALLAALERRAASAD